MSVFKLVSQTRGDFHRLTMVGYKLEVTTGDLKSAGTWDHIYVTLFGTEGQSERTELDNFGTDFSTRTFDNYSWVPSISLLLRKPPPTTKGQSSMETLLETLPNVGETVKFAALFCLLSETYSDMVPIGAYPKERFNEPAPKQMIKEFQAEFFYRLTMVQYKIEVTTGVMKSAGTWDHIYVTLFGTEGQSERTELDNFGTDYSTGTTGTYNLSTDLSMGKLLLFKVEKDPFSYLPEDEWYLSKIVVTTPEGEAVLFPCYRWISRGELVELRGGRALKGFEEDHPLLIEHREKELMLKKSFYQ
ncbi:Hydroperoxide isomerase ALOXE3 [Liparis tanakae]|uniref:Hydroperoxide isomerase ALOXE3 n=1 Tax=Liparis tanakae TaxID=230148 RepID=A0A4Z2HK54_9TELE|nr:Hydroperoxide isomerase ALOXE3 [Liparis tanakae]